MAVILLEALAGAAMLFAIACLRQQSRNPARQRQHGSRDGR